MSSNLQAEASQTIPQGTRGQGRRHQWQQKLPGIFGVNVRRPADPNVFAILSGVTCPRKPHGKTGTGRNSRQSSR